MIYIYTTEIQLRSVRQYPASFRSSSGEVGLEDATAVIHSIGDERRLFYAGRKVD